MKTYQQMAQAVFSARDDYLRKKQRQKVLFFRYAPVMASFGFVVVMGLHPWQNRQNFPAVPNVPEETAVQTESETTSATTVPESVPAIITETRIPETVPESPSETLPEISTTAIQTSAEIQTSVMIQTTTQTVQPIQNAPEPVTEAPELVEVPEAVPITEQPEIIPETVPPTETIPETTTIPAESETLPIIAGQTEEIPDTVPDELTEQGASIAFAFPRITLHLAKNSLGNDSGEDAVFCLTGNTVSPELVGEWFDTIDVTVRYPDGSQKLVENIGNAYLIEGMPYGTAAAVQFEGEENYYLFRSADISEEEFRNLFFNSENQNQ